MMSSASRRAASLRLGTDSDTESASLRWRSIATRRPTRSSSRKLWARFRKPPIATRWIANSSYAPGTLRRATIGRQSLPRASVRIAAWALGRRLPDSLPNLAETDLAVPVRSRGCREGSQRRGRAVRGRRSVRSQEARSIGRHGARPGLLHGLGCATSRDRRRSRSREW
jgi:hypothetical protein